MTLHTANFKERRKSPRFLLKQPVDIILANGDIITVESRNISSAGLQIMCDGWVTDEIQPRGIQSHNTTQLCFKISMDLQENGEARKIYATCRVVSQHRQSQDEYMLNLAFVDFDNGSDVLLFGFLEQFTQKKTVSSATA